MLEFFNPVRNRYYFPKTISSLFLVVLLIWSCKSKQTNKEKDYEHHNFIVLLDLSDRILDLGQISKDKEVIELIWNQFREISKKKLFIHSRDIFQIVVAEQDSSSLNDDARMSFQDSLNLDLSGFKKNEKKVFARNKIRVDEFSVKLKNNISYLYSNASEFSNPKDYRGADICKFFDEDIVKRLKKGYNNHVFILTDGELFVKKAGRVFKEDFPLTSFKKKDIDMDVCMLEIKTSDRNSFLKLKREWSAWYSDMGITELSFMKSDDNSSLERTLVDFLYSEDRRDFKIEPINIGSSNLKTKKVKTTNVAQSSTRKTQTNMNDDPLKNSSDDDFLNEYIIGDLQSKSDKFKKKRLMRLKQLLESKFPNKNSSNYSIACSYKGIILDEMGRNSMDCTKLKTYFQEKCPY